jgi:hypothetical protein
MKFAFALVTTVVFAACSAKVQSNGAPAPKSPDDLTQSPASQELKVKGVTEGSDGVNEVVVVSPNAAAKEVNFTLDAKESGKLDLSLMSAAEYVCSHEDLVVEKYWEDMTGGGVQSSTVADGMVDVIAGHYYRVRYSVTSAASCDGYKEQFMAAFYNTSAALPEASTPAVPDERAIPLYNLPDGNNLDLGQLKLDDVYSNGTDGRTGLPEHSDTQTDFSMTATWSFTLDAPATLSFDNYHGTGYFSAEHVSHIVILNADGTVVSVLPMPKNSMADVVYSLNDELPAGSYKLLFVIHSARDSLFRVSFKAHTNH